jgi:hypothetical protein
VTQSNRDEPAGRPEDPNVLSRLVRARHQGPRAVSALRDDLARDSRLGYSYLGIGAIVVGSLLLLRGLGGFVLGQFLAPGAGSPLLGILAWLLLLVTFAGWCLLARRFHGRIPAVAFTTVLVALALALLIDVAGQLDTRQPIITSSAVFGVAAVLLAMVGYRPARQLLLVNGAFALIVVALIAASAVDTGFTPGIAMEIAATTLLPPLLGTLIVRDFGRLVQLELDRSVAESTLLAPRFAFGMRASDELARLDLDAERILDDVASGAVELPLAPELAGRASSIATELRLLLLAGRHETWLHHAIEESEVLGPAVTLSDPNGLAGSLEPSEREGLLSAVWLLVANGRMQPTVQITIGDPVVDPRGDTPDRIGFPVVLRVEGVPRRTIDPAVWPALDRLGDHSVEGMRHTVTIATSVRTVAQQAVS